MFGFFVVRLVMREWGKIHNDIIKYNKTHGFNFGEQR